MKLIILISLFIISFNSLGQSYSLNSGSAIYEIKHLIKRVSGESNKLKGKIVCVETECEFLLAIPLNTFTSSDSNRDLNMLNIVEASKFPITTAKGKFPSANMKQEKWELPVEIDFHGIKKTYHAQVINKKNFNTAVNLIIKLEEHQIERPSLFGMKINNEVKMDFNLLWNQGS